MTSRVEAPFTPEYHPQPVEQGSLVISAFKVLGGTFGIAVALMTLKEFGESVWACIQSSCENGALRKCLIDGAKLFGAAGSMLLLAHDWKILSLGREILGGAHILAIIGHFSLSVVALLELFNVDSADEKAWDKRMYQLMRLCMHVTMCVWSILHIGPLITGAAVPAIANLLLLLNFVFCMLEWTYAPQVPEQAADAQPAAAV